MRVLLTLSITESIIKIKTLQAVRPVLINPACLEVFKHSLGVKEELIRLASLGHDHVPQMQSSVHPCWCYF